MSVSTALAPVTRLFASVSVLTWRRIATALVTLWLLWLVAKAVWRIEDAINWVPPAPVPTTEFKTERRAIDIEAIVRLNLFGNAAQVIVEQRTEEAPDTTVPLKLLGVYAAETPLKASAIVSQNNGQQAVVFVGDDLPGGYGKLKEVFHDRIVIDRNGRLETLRMEDLTGQLAAMMQVQTEKKIEEEGTQTLDKRYDPQVLNAVQDFRQKLNTDPASLSDVMRIEPSYVNGQMQGYKIGPGKDRKLFARFGLQANDLVTAINGVQLDDPTRAFAMMNDLNSATELNVTLKRGDQTLNLLLNMQQEN